MATAIDSVDSPRSFGFGLKALLLAITGACILLTPAQWFGGAYLVSVVLSITLVVSGTLAYRQAPVLALVWAFVAVIFGIPLVMVAVVFLSHAFLNFVLCIFLSLGRVRTKTFAIATGGLAVGLYGFVLWDGYERVRELLALRAKYPLQSLEQRLAFEGTSTKPAGSLLLTPAITAKLDELEQFRYYAGYRDRQWVLKELHENINTHFSRAAGFGISRMGNIYPGRDELGPQPPLTMPATLTGVSSKPAATELITVHDDVLVDFANPDRIGYVRSRKEVAGFESHRVTANSQLSSEIKDTSRCWHVIRLELVSLLGHDTPRVYVADQLPAMDELAEVPHRALNKFEASSLPRLETTEDVVIDQRPGRIQMLGAVRAATNCLECHEGQRGRLLGAFSYEITPLANTNQAAN